MVSQQKKIQHLLLRAGFICSPADVASLSAMSVKDVADKLWNDSNVVTPLQSAPIEAIKRPKDMTQEERKEALKKQVKEGRDLNLEWISNMSTTNIVFREKMTLFWHGHFACRSPL